MMSKHQHLVRITVYLMVVTYTLAQSVQTDDTNMCPFDVAQEDDKLFTWPETALGEVAFSEETCPPGTDNAGFPIAVRRCNLSASPEGEWDSVQILGCSKKKTPNAVPDYCPPGWYENDQFCYFVSLDQLTFSAAVEACETRNSSLVSIHSVEEQLYLLLIHKKIANGMDLWIGLNDRADDSTFEWVDGTPLDYLSWSDGQPSNILFAEDCVYLWSKSGGNWNDYFCDSKNGFICKTSKVQIENPNVCPFNVTQEDDELLTWPETALGEVAFSEERCPSGTDNAGFPIAIRRCNFTASFEGQWGSVQILGCSKEEEVNEVTDIFNQALNDLSNMDVTANNTLETANKLLTILNSTEETEGISEGQMMLINEILRNIVDVKNPSLEVTESVVNVVDIVMERYTPSARDPDSIPKDPNQIQRSLEEQISTLQTNPGNETITGSNVAIETVKIPQESLVNSGVLFEVTTGQTQDLNTKVKTAENRDEPSNTGVVATISFQPTETMLNNNIGITDTKPLNVSFLAYSDDILFPSSLLARQSGDEANNKVRRILASSVITATVEGKQITDLPMDQPVQCVFALNTVSKGELDKINKAECVFWDTLANNGIGDWSGVGCQYIKTSDAYAVCKCDHLTSFAVIVDIHGQSSLVLDIISTIGCGISICCLTITLATYLSNRSLRRVKPKKILISFCSSLLCLYTVFVLGIERGNKTDSLCITVSVLLHYFTLTSMAWMAVEAFHMYVSFVKVVGRWSYIPKFIMKASLLAWGLPAVIVAVLLAVDIDQYNNTEYCFLKIGYVLYFGHLLVIGLIVGGNCIIFVMVINSLMCGRKVGTKKDSREETKRRILNVTAITVLMGLTWVFGFLALIHENSSLLFQYLFCIFNSLQGACIFVMFCLLQPDVIAIWKEKLSGGHNDNQNVATSLTNR